MIGRTVVNGSKAESHDVTAEYISGSTGRLFSNYNYSMVTKPITGKWDIRINERITSLDYMFTNQTYLEGTITFNCKPTSYAMCFRDMGSTVIVNYTSICTNIDDVLATGGVTKGVLVV